MPRASLTDAELEATRRRLAAAALEIYRAKGLEAITFRRIAEVLGISHTRSYRYFDNKEALLARVRVDALKRLDAHVRTRTPVRGGAAGNVRAAVDAFIEYGRDWPDDYLLIFATHQPASTEYPELLAARRQLFDYAVELVQAAIDAGQINGEARQLAHAVWVSVNGLMTLHAANQLVHGYTLDELIEPVLGGLLAAACAATAADQKPARSTAACKNVS
jgi:AcrR family transcriptional regulator